MRDLVAFVDHFFGFEIIVTRLGQLGVKVIMSAAEIQLLFT